MHHPQTRRQFLKTAAAGAGISIIPARVLWGAEAPSNQLTRALIGFGCIAHSTSHLKYQGSRLIGLCDPFEYRVRHGLATAEKVTFTASLYFTMFLRSVLFSAMNSIAPSSLSFTVPT